MGAKLWELALIVLFPLREKIKEPLNIGKTTTIVNQEKLPTIYALGGEIVSYFVWKSIYKSAG